MQTCGCAPKEEDVAEERNEMAHQLLRQYSDNVDGAKLADAKHEATQKIERALENLEEKKELFLDKKRQYEALHVTGVMSCCRRHEAEHAQELRKLKADCERAEYRLQEAHQARDNVRIREIRHRKMEEAISERVHRIENPPGYTMRKLCGYDGESSFADAIESNGLRHQKGLAYLIAVGRLIFWHLLQPILYGVVFNCEIENIDPLQRKLGWAVALREVVYFVSTWMCLWINPDFLLVDVMACKRDLDGQQTGGSTVSFQSELAESLMAGWGFVMMYVFSPEKFVIWAGFDNGGVAAKIGEPWGGRVRNFFLVAGVLLDCAGVAALFAGFRSETLPVTLAIGYGATAIGGVCFIFLVLRVTLVRRGCCEKCRKQRGVVADELDDHLLRTRTRALTS